MRQRVRSAFLAFAILLITLAAAPGHAQERSVPPPLPHGALCAGFVPCAESGPFSGNVRIQLQLSEVPGIPEMAFGGAASMSLSLWHWAELGTTMFLGEHKALGPTSTPAPTPVITTFGAGPISLWGRLSPPFLSGLFSDKKDIGVSVAGWLQLDAAPPPTLDFQRTLYPDTETYGLIVRGQLLRLDLTGYGAVQTADSRGYFGVEGGGALSLLISRTLGLQIGGELLARAGQHDGQPATSALWAGAFVSISDDYGRRMSFPGLAAVGHASASAPSLVGLSFGVSFGPSYKSEVHYTPSWFSSVRASVLFGGLPQLPQQLVAPGAGCAWRGAEARASRCQPDCDGQPLRISLYRPCRVAGFGLGAGIPYQVGGALPEVDPVEPEPPREGERPEEFDPVTGRRRELDPDEIVPPGATVRTPPRPDVPYRPALQDGPSIGMPRGPGGQPLPFTREVRSAQQRGVADRPESPGWRGDEPSLPRQEQVRSGVADRPEAPRTEPRPRERLPVGTRRAVDEAARGDGGAVYCRSCGVRTTSPTPRARGSKVAPTEKQYDHVVPWSRGGSNDPTNLEVKCAACNNSKGAKDEATWKAQRQNRGPRTPR